MSLLSRVSHLFTINQAEYIRNHPFDKYAVAARRRAEALAELEGKVDAARDALDECVGALEVRMAEKGALHG